MVNVTINVTLLYSKMRHCSGRYSSPGDPHPPPGERETISAAFRARACPFREPRGRSAGFTATLRQWTRWAFVGASVFLAGASHCWPDPSRFNWMARIHLVRHGRPLPEPPHPHPTSLVWDCLREGWMGCRAAFLFCSAPPQPRPAGSYGAEPPSSPAVPKLRRGLAAQVTTRVALDDVGWLHLWTAAGFSRAYPPRCPTSEVQEWVASGRCPSVRPRANFRYV